jgi:peroxiredoxin Q/BCP
MSRFRDDAATYRELGAEVVGVSADTPDRNLAWSRALKLPFRLLSDRDGRVATAFGAWDDTWRLPKRVTFIVDRSGVVRHVESGGLAIDTSRTLDALRTLARAR